MSDRQLASARRQARAGDRHALLLLVRLLDRAGRLPAPGSRNPPVTLRLLFRRRAEDVLGDGSAPRPANDPSQGGVFRVHPWRVQSGRAPAGAEWTPCRAVARERVMVYCPHCGGRDEVVRSRDFLKRLAPRMQLHACSRCSDRGSVAKRARKLGEPGRYYLCPTTDRGQVYWHEGRSLPFDSVGELCDYLRTQAANWLVA